MKSFQPLKTFSRITSPIFAAGAYLCAGVSAILLVICLIVPIVNVPTSEMLLPPFMRMDGAKGLYEISLGNGIVIRRAAEQVSLGDIKTAIYCGIAVAVVVLLVLMPIFYLLSRLLRSVAQDKLFDMSNSLGVKRIGLMILIGNTAALFAERFFNYHLVHTFLAEGEEVVFRAGIDVIGIVMGLLVILIGNIYGYAIQMHNAGLDARDEALDEPEKKEEKKRFWLLPPKK